MKFFVSFVLIFVSVVGGSVIRNHESIAPTFDAFRDCRLFLQTRENRGNPVELFFQNIDSITQSVFRRDRPLRVWIHGWNNGPSTGANNGVARVLLDRDDFNYIYLDWSAGAQTGANYLTARNRVSSVGEFLGAFLDWLHENNQINLEEVSLIGFSLGAHVAGHTGKNVRRGRIGTIFGLDPAGPLFSINNPAERLASGDALYVEAIHTNGRANGIGAPIADADFFPNGGMNQPGCATGSGCSHSRAVEFYMESVINNRFIANRCANADDAENGRCVFDGDIRMGGEPSNLRVNLRGIFHLTTNSETPFGRG